MGDLRLRVLGAFEVEGVDALHLGSRKARTLLKILALARRRPVSVDRLADCLWPSEAPARPAAEVAVLVSRLRSALGAERLVRSDAGYELRADWLDLDALAELVEEASRRLAAGSWALARTAAAAALALDRGSLLADEPDAPWAEVERSGAGRLLSQARHTAGLAALAAGDPIAAAEQAQRLLDHDPYDEAALRLLMAAHTAAGRPASALAAYGAARARLAEDLGVSPSAATEAVHTAILREEPIPGVVVGTPGAPEVPAPLGQPALPGRDAELTALDAALERTAAGGPEIVVVEGEAGMGKTRLLSVWGERARAAGATVLTGGCDELERSLPLEAVVDAVGRHLRSLGPGAATRLLGAGGPVLAPLLGRGTAADELTPAFIPMAALSDPAAGRAVLFDALLGVLGRAGGDAPAVLLLDDAHLAGGLTVDWLRFASRRGSGLRLLVVAARRPEEGQALPATSTIALGPLDLEAAGAVVGPERAAALHARSGGNPLFLVELAAAEGADLPASIREAVAARCQRAGGAAASTLRTAAVIGGDVDLDLLAGVLRLSPTELLDHLEEGVRRRLLVESGSTFAFGHELVREALAAGASVSRRALVHREAGRVLAARPEPDPLAVAYHARLGGDEERAAAALCEAARLASARHDHAEAERRLDQALALRDVPEARLQRARARIMRQDFAGGAEDARAALGQGGGAPALEAAGWAAYYLRDLGGARRLADDGAALATDSVMRASCLSLGGYVRVMTGDLLGAEVKLDEAAALAGGPGAVVTAGIRGTLRIYQGRAEEGLELIHPATLPEAPAPGHFGTRSRFMAGYALALLGRPAEALAVFEDLVVDIDRRGVSRYIPMVCNFQGWILRNLGAEAEADDVNERALEAASGLPDERYRLEPRAHGFLDLAEGRLRAGDLDAVRAYLAKVEPLQQVEHTLRWRHELRARLLEGRLALAAGAAEAAEAAAMAVAEDAGRLGVDRYSAPACLLEARARAAAGEAVDVDAVGTLLEALPRHAGLEAWWLTAEMAAAAGVDAWWTMAEQRAADLIKRSGPHADSLGRYAAARLERMRTAGRSG